MRRRSAPCAVARSDADGVFAAADVPAGQLRLQTFDQATFQQGEVRVQLGATASVAVTILLGQGLATVRGVVLTPEGAPVVGAEVGGGLSLTTTNAQGEFTLTDVPVGRREIVAVSQALNADARTTVDIVRAGEEVNATLVLSPRARLAGVVRRADGVTPAANVAVYVFQNTSGANGEAEIIVLAELTADAQGRFTSGPLPLGDYGVSAMLASGTEGQARIVPLRFANEIANADLVFRGQGRITGVVLDADGRSPLRAAVGVSGPVAQLAGGRVLTGFVDVLNYGIAQSDLTTGRFVLTDVWTGPFTLAAVGPFSPDPISFEGDMPSAGATVDVELRLQPTARITGLVTLPDGVTPAPRNVRLKYKSTGYRLLCAGLECKRIPQGIQNFDAITDDEGKFLFEPLNPGPFTDHGRGSRDGPHSAARGRTARRPGRPLHRAPARTGAGHRARAQQQHHHAHSRRARRESSRPSSRSDGWCSSPTPRARSPSAAATPSAEGQLAVLATDVRNGFQGRANGAVKADGQAVTLDVYLFNASGSVIGRATQADGITPIASAQVVVSNTAGPLAFTISDADGAYRVETLPIGDVFVRVFDAATAGRGFGQGRIDFDQQEALVNVRQAPIGLITGRVIDRTTLEPLRNWQVFLVQRTPFGQVLPELRTTTGLSGEFQFPGVIAGRFDLTASNFLPGRPTGAGIIDGFLAREGQQVDVPFPVRVDRQVAGRGRRARGRPQRPAVGQRPGGRDRQHRRDDQRHH